MLRSLAAGALRSLPVLVARLPGASLALRLPPRAVGAAVLLPLTSLVAGLALHPVLGLAAIRGPPVLPLFRSALVLRGLRIILPRLRLLAILLPGSARRPLLAPLPLLGRRLSRGLALVASVAP